MLCVFYVREPIAIAAVIAVRPLVTKIGYIVVMPILLDSENFAIEKAFDVDRVSHVPIYERASVERHID